MTTKNIVDSIQTLALKIDQSLLDEMRHEDDPRMYEGMRADREKLDSLFMEIEDIVRYYDISGLNFYLEGE